MFYNQKLVLVNVINLDYLPVTTSMLLFHFKKNILEVKEKQGQKTGPDIVGISRNSDLQTLLKHC
jgi:hypothetical protein